MGIRSHLHTKAQTYHAKTPLLRKLPFAALAIIAAVAAVNGVVWVAVGVVLVSLFGFGGVLGEVFLGRGCFVGFVGFMC